MSHPPGSPAGIPFNRPYLAGPELAYMQQALANGHIAGDGAFTRRAQGLLEDLLGRGRILLTTSCTDALELAALLLDIQPGDEVIVPSYTFVSTANAFVLRGAVPVFSDVRPDTLNLDESRLEHLVGPRTRAVVPVHYAGVACEMDAIVEIARRHGLAIVEDNAHGLLGGYKGQALGTLGDLATLSFHETKNISCGEGGALVVNREELVSRAEILREKGTDRSRFFRGLVDKYSWVDVGSSYLPSDLLAAFLCAQLERADAIQERRSHLWENYRRLLSDWAAGAGVRMPIVPPHCRPAYHMFYLLMPTESARDALLRHLKQHDILAVFHYLPLHRSAMGRRFAPQARCPVAEDVSGRLVRLPFYNSMTDEEQRRVADTVQAFRA